MSTSGTTSDPKPKRPQTRHLRPKPPWRKGESGNPAGLPKGFLPITSRVKNLLAEASRSGDSTKADAVAAALLKYAMKGSHHHLRIMLDRIEGPVTQKVEHSVEEQTLKIVRGVDEEKV